MDAMDDAATVLGFPRVNAAALPDGVRELRIGDSYSMMPGAAEPVLRLLHRPGRATTGQVVFVWHEAQGQGRFYRETTCTTWTGSSRRCAFVSPVALDWTTIAARFEALGAWSITGSCEMEHRTTPNGKDEIVATSITDSGDLHLGRIVGGVSSIYFCNAPRARSGTDVGRAAKAIYEYFREVAKQAGDPPNA